MIVTVASFKGGVAKTTTAVHLAAYLQQQASTLLIDSDPNRSATRWGSLGKLPFKVIDERQAAKYVPRYEHALIDTQARPTQADLEALAEGCDLLVVPSTPDALALDALIQTVNTLKAAGSERFRVLLTIVPPPPNKDVGEAQQMLADAGLPCFGSYIRRFVAFQKAALAGVPVYKADDPRARTAWFDYKRVGQELEA